ncbi:hypothetical protein HMPREF9303_0285 [Prevotella denticola CRIS 18C-A]|uniref:Uncharacterized protein n=1 Tax=Prevotella denticola CRIS 18C-A TaxID=944557 RepID=F0H5J8_9BACT|nr:hypothetical protein HMPREF9137_1044 [Prevotella denticola F0289]EGC86880.1 hypothetical protein HMPREF9303_0285 [Prevotella denticola CRIS 18C-A]
MCPAGSWNFPISSSGTEAHLSKRYHPEAENTTYSTDYDIP